MLKASRFAGCPVAVGAAIAMLAGCDGQTSIAPPQVSVQSRVQVQRQGHGGSWILQDTSNEDLLYASGQGGSGVEVLAYPKGSVVGRLTFHGASYGLCSDRSGDVFIPVWSSQTNTNYIYEYSHGGTEPIATLTDSGVPFGCAVDPTTGNLAVTNVFGLGTDDPPGNVAIYADAQGTATYYKDLDINLYGFCAYDDAGNLFVTDQGRGPIGELPEGSGSFENISTNMGTSPGSIQWNDGELVVAAYDGDEGTQNVYRLKIAGTYGTVVGTTSLQDWGRTYRKKYLIFAQFWVEGASIIGPSFLGGRGLRPSFWHYPKGGKPVKVFRQPGFRMTDAGGAGVTISVAPSKTRTRR